jgi:serine/threonine protein kinase
MEQAHWTVPGYLLDTPLGNGPASEVWRGRAAGSLHPVALKRIELHHVTELVSARSAAALLVELDHPHLIRLHEFIPTGTAAVLVLDLAAGGSLADLLEERGRLAASEVIAALEPIAAALAYLHGSGVVHGDVSPANVLFTEVGLPMLADLGVARLHGDTSSVHSTPAYIDPGVAAGFLPGPESDVFMLAGVAVHALTGTELWRGGAVEHVLLMALTANLGDLDARLDAAAVPDQLQAVLRRALAIEPARRGSAAEFALGLRQCAEQDAVRRPTVPIAVKAESSDVVHLPTGSVTAAVETPTATADEIDPPGRPRFERPAAGTDHLRQGEIARSTRRSRGGHRYRRSIWDRFATRWVVAAGCVGAVLVGAGVAWGISGADTKHPAGASATSSTADITPAPAVDGAVETLEVGSTSPTSGGFGATTAVGISAADASNVLIQLDAIREQAFARRAPLLLTGVYEPGVLLDEDTASLERIVPPGCGLEGVHTAYSNVQVTARSGSEVDLTAQATLSPSVLFCNGVAKAQAPGSGPSTLHITLVGSGTHYLIHSVSS